MPAVAGAGSNDTRVAILNANHAQKLGADAALHVAGYYNRPSQEGLFRHFEAVHEATELPIIVYNIPPRAVVDILPETMARIAALPRVVGDPADAMTAVEARLDGEREDDVRQELEAARRKLRRQAGGG